jgi:hypothetical protein
LDALAAAVDPARIAPWRSGVAGAWPFAANERDGAAARLDDAPRARVSADDAQALILARCSAEIAAGAGPGTVAHAIGARRPQGALIRVTPPRVST